MRLHREVTAGPYRVRDMRYVRGFTYTPHAHDEVQVSVLVHGWMREDVGGGLHRASAGDLVLKPAGTLHANEFEDARIVCIDFAPDALDDKVGAYAWHRIDSAAAIAFRVARRFFRADDVVDDIDALLAALAERRSRDHRLAKRAAELLDASFADSIQVRDVATALGVHPVYLARVFREQWSCTPREYLQRVRVRAAIDRIASSAQSLADVAFENGFSDQAHMTRLVARRMGLPPAALRRLARD